VASVSVHYQGHSRTLTLANVHLGLAGFERKSQLNRLLGHSLMSCHHKNSPILIGGDFNDVWGNLGKHIMIPAGFTSAGEAIHTFPATLPLRPLDRIFIRGAVLVHNAFAGHTRLAKKASDHLPLVVDLEIQF
jgi:endonuclease/exonuclease/phosphatase family metal-dependent hydrolase